MKWILASASPRRRDILQSLGISLNIMPSHADEDIHDDDPVKFAESLSLIKTGHIKPGIHEIVIGADTIVVRDNNILGKPYDKVHARKMLADLAGNWHEVITGITVCGTDFCDTRSAVTRVLFKDLSGVEIAAYLERADWADKAGAYGIQGLASLFVKQISGCYFNVVGFPVNLFYTILKEHNIDLFGEM